MSHSKKYFSTFSGIGGFELGITKAHENKGAHRKQKSGQSSVLTRGDLTNAQHRTGRKAGPECVGFSEIDKYAKQIYQKHFDHKDYGDITKIDEKKLPAFDLFVGGFPCQAFSIAGKRAGFKDTRGTLFFDIARILKATKKGYAIARGGDSVNLSNLGSDIRRGRVGKQIAQTIDTGMQQFTLEGNRLRRLTPLECERLMGFPDNHTAGVSNTQRYKMCGNAVVSNVVEAIISRLI